MGAAWVAVDELPCYMPSYFRIRIIVYRVARGSSAVGIARCGNGHRAGLVGRADRGAFFSAVSRLVPATL
jgi:hypothetical protein